MVRKTVRVGAFAVCFGLSGICWSQGYFRFSNFEPLDGLDAPVFDAQGNKLSGSNYLAMLYVAPAVDSLQPVLSDSRGALAIQPFLTSNGSGYIVRDTVRAENVTGGTIVWAQMRAWDARLGT